MVCRILPEGPVTIPTPGKPHSDKLFVFQFAVGPLVWRKYLLGFQTLSVCCLFRFFRVGGDTALFVCLQWFSSFVGCHSATYNYFIVHLDSLVVSFLVHVYYLYVS